MIPVWSNAIAWVMYAFASVLHDPMNRPTFIEWSLEHERKIALTALDVLVVVTVIAYVLLFGNPFVSNRNEIIGGLFGGIALALMTIFKHRDKAMSRWKAIVADRHLVALYTGCYFAWCMLMHELRIVELL
jgi:uncharacterized YccA/Bax inhibitor family protein